MHTMRVRGRAIPEGSPCQMKREIATASASEATEPTERSSPPTEREVDTPMAITVTIDMERRMLTMFVAERKLGLAIPKKRTRRTIVMIVPHR
jgi:hypothetical protein